MKRVVSILIAMALLITLLPTPILRAIYPTPGYNPNYCELWINGSDIAVISCKPEGLSDPSGIFIDNLDLNNTYTVNIYKYYYADGSDRIQFTLIQDSNPHISFSLPFGDYTCSNKTVIHVSGWALRITYYLNGTYYQEWVYLYPENYTNTIGLPPGAVITDITVKTAQPYVIASPPPVPDWWNLPGWISYLAYIVGQFAQYFPTALEMLVIVGDIFLKLAGVLVIAIPLSIIGALTVGIEEAFHVINFWFSLFKKLYDLFMKVIHVIAQIIQDLKPV